MSNFVVNIVLYNDLLSLGPRTSAGTVTFNFESHWNTGLTFEPIKYKMSDMSKLCVCDAEYNFEYVINEEVKPIVYHLSTSQVFVLEKSDIASVSAN